ncbi:MAG: peptide-methionine (S)-S-oxide reductase MsrA [Planctomycetota bacterium]|nr:peptide-methionine (S)-S-oxide reductase MsrA [Planctomycetota bacterium]
MAADDRDWRALSDAEWRERLTPEQYAVLRRAATEPPFCAAYAAFHEQGPGIYRCAGCGLALFDRADAFVSGTGWPSFSGPIPGSVGYREDRSHGLERIEVHCARCAGHLGHVFPDGPPPSGLRFCINGIALVHEPAAVTRRPGLQLATFGGGCFWGVEAVFAAQGGVLDAVSGYMGGQLPYPSYRQVCGGDTGHTEVVQVTFDPAVIDYAGLLAVFFEQHDPTTPNRQGPDIGWQYRSVIFAHDETQAAQARAAIAAIDASRRLPRPVVTAVEPAARFWRAEEYHQDYAARHGHGACHRPHGVPLTDVVRAALDRAR